MMKQDGWSALALAERPHVLKHCIVRGMFVIHEMAKARDHTARGLCGVVPHLVLPAPTRPDGCITKHRSSTTAGKHLLAQGQYFPASVTAVEVKPIAFTTLLIRPSIAACASLVQVGCDTTSAGFIIYQCLIRIVLQHKPELRNTHRTVVDECEHVPSCTQLREGAMPRSSTNTSSRDALVAQLTPDVAPCAGTFSSPGPLPPRISLRRSSTQASKTSRHLAYFAVNTNLAF